MPLLLYGCWYGMQYFNPPSIHGHTNLPARKKKKAKAELGLLILLCSFLCFSFPSSKGKSIRQKQKQKHKPICMQKKKQKQNWVFVLLYSVFFCFSFPRPPSGGLAPAVYPDSHHGPAQNRNERRPGGYFSEPPSPLIRFSQAEAVWGFTPASLARALAVIRSPRACNRVRAFISLASASWRRLALAV